MRISSLKFLTLVCIALASISCERKITKASQVNQAQKQIKTTMETIHDPIEYEGGVDNNPEISENSFIIKIYFDSKGKVVTKDQFNSSGNREFRTTLKYNEKENLIERITYRFKTVTSRQVNKFNASHKLIESNVFNEYGKNVERKIFRAVANGSSIGLVYTLDKGVLVKTSESLFDDKGRVVETQHWTDERLTGKEINQFDARGNLIEAIIQYPLKKEEQRLLFKYDSLNNKIETIVLNGSLMIESKILTRYDSRGNITELISYGIKGNVKERIMHRYEYDQEGNWIKDITLVNKKPTSVIIRKIEYY
jgi:hypothetical protein